MPSAAAIGRIQNASHFADRSFQIRIRSIFDTCLPDRRKGSVKVRHLLSLEMIWSARIRGQCMAIADSPTYGIFH
jgi:hypothetical protein